MTPPAPNNNIPTPRISNYLKEHDCGNKPEDNYGNDWSHYDIEAFVDLARTLERELIQLQQENEKLRAEKKE